jgi:hypothetical protein
LTARAARTAQYSVTRRVTADLLDYWNALRGARPVPDRCDIDPGAIRACLADTFVLGVESDHGHRFRIAGTAICAMFGYELTLTSFDGLWAADDRRLVSNLVDTVAEDAEPAIADVTGRNTDDEAIDLEMVLLPLTSAGGGTGRILGALVPVAAPYWLGARPLQMLHGARRHANGSKLLPGECLARSRTGWICGPEAVP